MELRYFGEINPNNVEEYYEVEIKVDGRMIDIDINFEEESCDEASLREVGEFLQRIDAVIAKAMADIEHDYRLGDESDAAVDYLEHHLEILGEQELQAIFGGEKVDKESFLASLEAQRIGFYPDDDESFMLVDVAFKGGITNYLMAVTYSRNGELSWISMES